MPEAGQCSSAASSASWQNPSARVTSRSIRDSPVISRGCSIRQTAWMVRLMPAAVMAADRIERTLASRTVKRTNFARSFPARHVVLMELHELDCRGHRLFLVPQLEDCIAADNFLGLNEWAVDDTELAIGNAHLGAGGDRHQPTAVKHAAGLDLAVGALV